MVKIEKVKVTKSKPDSLHDEKMEHPAQGCVTVTKPMGGSKALFGSDLKHSSTVRVKVSTATGHRGLHEDRHFDDKTICEFEFSEAQWAQFVSSIGIGNGVPCTFTYRPADDYKLMQMPLIEKETLVEKNDRDIRESTQKYLAEINEMVARLDAMLSGGSKAGIKDLMHDLKNRLGNLPSNMGFIQKQLVEAVDNSVQAGKQELEAFARNTLVRAGMAKFAEATGALPAADEIVSLPGPGKGD